MPDQEQPTPASNEQVEKDSELLSDEDVIKRIQPLVEQAEEAYKDKRDVYEACERLYNGLISIGSDVQDLATQYSGGEGYNIVETLLPRLIAGRIRADAIPDTSGDSKAAQKQESLLNAQIEEQGLSRVLEDWIRQATKTLGILKVDSSIISKKVLKRKRKYAMRVPLTQKYIGVGPIVEDQEEKEQLQHILETVPWENVVVNPADRPGQVPMVGMKTAQTLQALKDDGRYKNINQLLIDIAKKEAGEVEVPEELLARLQDQNIQIPASLLRFFDKSVEYLELYYKHNDCVYILCVTEDWKTILRHEKLTNWHGQFPIQFLSLIGIENQIIGFSPLEISKPDIDIDDTWLNVLLTTGLFDVMRPVLYDPQKLPIDPQKNPLVYRPGAQFRTQGMTNINEAMTLLEAPKVDGSHLQIAQMLKLRRQNKSGLTDYISGSENIDGDKTLGEIELKTQQSNKRIQLIEKRVNEALGIVFSMMASNNQQYLPGRVSFRQFGGRGYEWQDVGPEEIQGGMRFRVRGTSNLATSESEKVNRYRAAIADGVKINSAVGQPIVDVVALARLLYEDGYSFDSPDRIVIPVQETNEATDMGMQEQGQAAMAENQNPMQAMVRPDDDHKVHMDIHQALMQSPSFAQLPPEVQQALQAHFAEHQQYLATSMQGQQPNPATQQLRPSDRTFTPPDTNG